MDFDMVGIVIFFLAAIFVYNKEKKTGDEQGVAWGGRYFFP